MIECCFEDDIYPSENNLLYEENRQLLVTASSQFFGIKRKELNPNKIKMQVTQRQTNETLQYSYSI